MNTHFITGAISVDPDQRSYTCMWIYTVRSLVRNYLIHLKPNNVDPDQWSHLQVQIKTKQTLLCIGFLKLKISNCKNQRGLIKNGTRKSYGSCALHFELLQETCTPSLESFEPMVTKLRSRQEMLYKNQSKRNNSKMEQGRVKVLVQCTSSYCQKHAYQVWSHLDLR
jgi:hypothetical protein